jgi:hypothetical protein
MIDGRNDVSFVANLVPRMAEFSDDGKTFHGAYGHRWRKHFGFCFDQLAMISDALRANPDDRRQVLSMWDAKVDLEAPSKDLPCNTHAYFSRDQDGRLDLMVCNRSNDAVWGACGSNAVHFSLLQELIAGLIGCEVGKYWQVSNNMHLYLERHEKLMNQLADRAFPSVITDPYQEGLVTPTPLLPKENPWTFLKELSIFLDEGLVLGITDPFLRKVAFPMLQASTVLRTIPAPDKYGLATGFLEQMPNKSDWRYAAIDWIEQLKCTWEAKHASTGE